MNKCVWVDSLVVFIQAVGSVIVGSDFCVPATPPPFARARTLHVPYHMCLSLALYCISNPCTLVCTRFNKGFELELELVVRESLWMFASARVVDCFTLLLARHLADVSCYIISEAIRDVEQTTRVGVSNHFLITSNQFGHLAIARGPRSPALEEGMRASLGATRECCAGPYA